MKRTIYIKDDVDYDNWINVDHIQYICDAKPGTWIRFPGVTVKTKERLDEVLTKIRNA